MTKLGQTKCPCGETLEIKGTPPKRFGPSIVKVKCLCESKYLFTISKPKKQNFNLNMQVLELSPSTEMLIKNNLRGNNEETKSSIAKDRD